MNHLTKKEARAKAAAEELDKRMQRRHMENYVNKVVDDAVDEQAIQKHLALYRNVEYLESFIVRFRSTLNIISGTEDGNSCEPAESIEPCFLVVLDVAPGRIRDAVNTLHDLLDELNYKLYGTK